MELPGLNFYHIFYYFAMYAFIGWCIETLYATFKEKRFVNRGFLNGPFCPIYGFGALILLFLLQPLKYNVIYLFFGSILLASVLEYITGFILEKTFHHFWWDYNNEYFNLHGRICLKFSLLWGGIAVLLLNGLHPHIASAVSALYLRYGALPAYLTLLYFLIDFATAVTSVLNLNSRLKQLSRLSEEIATRLESLKEAAAKLESLKETAAKLESLKETAAERMEDMEDMLRKLRSRYDFLLEKRVFMHTRLINAFPGLSSKHFNSILQDIRKRIEPGRSKKE